MITRIALLAFTLLLAACDIPGMGPDPRVAQKEADSRAIGGACRHALRGIEDCYNLNAKASKTAVFEGWKEMDQYMRENKLEGITPKIAKEQVPEETIIEESKPKAVSREKTSADAKARPEVALASPQRPPATKQASAESH